MNADTQMSVYGDEKVYGEVKILPELNSKEQIDDIKARYENIQSFKANDVATSEEGITQRGFKMLILRQTSQTIQDEYFRGMEAMKAHPDQSGRNNVVTEQVKRKDVIMKSINDEYQTLIRKIYAEDDCNTDNEEKSDDEVLHAGDNEEEKGDDAQAAAKDIAREGLKLKRKVIRTRQAYETAKQQYDEYRRKHPTFVPTAVVGENGTEDVI